jgi:hypothetical protein
MKNRAGMILISLIAVLVVGQVLAYLIAPASWTAFIVRLPVILAEIAFWGPICAIVAVGFIALALRILGFHSLAELRSESVEQNNPAPAIVFVGTFIASILFLMLVIRP